MLHLLTTSNQQLTTTRRARRGLVAALGLFALTQAALGGLAEVYPRFRDPLYGDKLAKLRTRAARSPGADVVVMLGSSRTGLAFHGKRVEETLAEVGRPAVAFNFGTPAAGPVTHLVYLKRMLRQGMRPTLLLVEVLPSMLADGQGGPIERHWFDPDRLTYSEQDAVCRHGYDAAAVHARWRRSVLVPAYTLRFQIVSRLAPSWLPWQCRFDWSRGSDECGWGAMQTQEIPVVDVAKGVERTRGEYAAILGNYAPGGPATDALKELLSVCRAENIPAGLVLMPEGSPFREWLPPDGEARLRDYLAGLTAETGVPLTDARRWLTDDDFYDAHHMLTRGALAFSGRLARDVIAGRLGASRER